MRPHLLRNPSILITRSIAPPCAHSSHCGSPRWHALVSTAKVRIHDTAQSNVHSGRLRSFHASCVSFDDNNSSSSSSENAEREASAQAIDHATNHYETLSIPRTASIGEVKKSFYTLSHTHHPDHNANTPSSSLRFQRLSEAYTTLSSPAKRAQYDLTLPGSPSATSASSPSSHSHSYASTHATAGGRPASGLSRRRAAFRGPPPSFFRSGGWGTQTEKRGSHHRESTGQGYVDPGFQHNRAGSENTARTNEGVGDGEDGQGRDPYPYQNYAFDRTSHEKTLRKSEEGLKARRRLREASASVSGGSGSGGGGGGTGVGEKGIAGPFFAILGIIFVGAGIVPLLGDRMGGGRLIERRAEREKR